VKLPSTDRRIHVQTRRLRKGLMNYTVEMGSSALIYIPYFIKVGSGIQKLKVRGTQI
jgi:hypothetical protein